MERRGLHAWVYAVAISGEPDQERGALAGITVDFDVPAVGFHQPPGDGQSQADAASGARARLVDPVEPLEDVGQVLSRDTRTAVSY